MKRTRWVVAGSVAAIVLFLVGVPTSLAPTTAPTDYVVCDPSTETPAQVIPDVSGTIRWVDSTTWIALDDAGHTPNGIASVQLLSDRVRVHYDFVAEKVSSFQATPDEAFTSASVRVGASVGLSYTDIYFYMPAYGATPVNPALLSKAGANVWLTGWFVRSE